MLSRQTFIGLGKHIPWESKLIQWVKGRSVRKKKIPKIGLERYLQVWLCTWGGQALSMQIHKQRPWGRKVPMEQGMEVRNEILDMGQSGYGVRPFNEFRFYPKGSGNNP